MEEKEYVTLDFTACKYISDLYNQMQTKMVWEDWYGHNLDALWDILTGLPHYGSDFTIIRPLQYTNIPHNQNTTFDRYVDKICTVFNRAQHEGYLTVHIEYR